MKLRVASVQDAASCLAIYRPHVETGTTSFETVVPTKSEFTSRIETLLPRFPWLIAEAETGVLGYAYAGPHRARQAYQWCAEVSVYVRPEAHRKGVARCLYEALFEHLRRQNYVNAFAGVTLPNDASVAFHTSMGFESVGIYRGIGFKFGAWRDVGWWQKRLAHPAEPAQPASPIPFSDL